MPAKPTIFVFAANATMDSWHARMQSLMGTANIAAAHAMMRHSPSS